MSDEQMKDWMNEFKEKAKLTAGLTEKMSELWNIRSGNKTIENLYKEVKRGETVIKYDEGGPIRAVTVVQVEIYPNDKKKYVLTEIAHYASGSNINIDEPSKKRNMLLSEKMQSGDRDGDGTGGATVSPFQPRRRYAFLSDQTHKGIWSDGDGDGGATASPETRAANATAERGIKEELGVGHGSHVQWLGDAQKTGVVLKGSHSYPGLRAKFTTFKRGAVINSLPQPGDLPQKGLSDKLVTKYGKLIFATKEFEQEILKRTILWRYVPVEELAHIGND